MAVLAAAAQPRCDNNAVFKTGIDVLTIEASVVDGEARPVPDLSAGDFDVKIGGDLRRVVSVRFVEANRTVARPRGWERRHSLTRVEPGRAARAYRRSSPSIAMRLAPAASAPCSMPRPSMLDALGPADAAGAVALPQGSTELTRDKERVKAALLAHDRDAAADVDAGGGVPPQLG